MPKRGRNSDLKRLFVGNHYYDKSQSCLPGYINSFTIQLIKIQDIYYLIFYRRMDDSYLDVSRNEAIMEGNRFLIEGLRERVSTGLRDRLT